MFQIVDDDFLVQFLRFDLRLDVVDTAFLVLFAALHVGTCAFDGHFEFDAAFIRRPLACQFVLQEKFFERGFGIFKLLFIGLQRGGADVVLFEQAVFAVVVVLRVFKIQLGELLFDFHEAEFARFGFRKFFRFLKNGVVQLRLAEGDGLRLLEVDQIILRI